MKNINNLINELEIAREELKGDIETKLEEETLYNINETLRCLRDLRKVQSE